MDVLLEGGLLLQQRDYTLVIDCSREMAEIDPNTGQSYWDSIRQSALATITKCEEYDGNGLAVYVFADDFKRYDRVTARQASHIFSQHQPRGGANLATVLREIANDYFRRKISGTAKPNGETAIVLTAGQPTSPEALERAMIDISQKLDRDEEFGISFIQVNGNRLVTQFLNHLDNNLVEMGAKFDICSTVTIDRLQNTNLTKVLLDAVVD